MKIFLLILTILIFFSCEKDELEKEQCWICTETVKQSGKVLNVTVTEVCDILEVAKLDGKRYSKSLWNGNMKIITWYFTECEEKR